MKAPTAAVLLGAALILGASIATAHASLPSGAANVTATLYGDQRVTATSSTAQTLVTTASTTFSGAPVTVDFGVEYVNMIPDPSSCCNGIEFYLYEDGISVERLTLVGNHNSGLNSFGPVFVHTILDGALTPTAGAHVFSVTVAKWAPNQDGYLRANDGQPIRLTVSQP